jgi:uncharacterized membrane protein YtjA (UPF0391 family)
MLYYALVFLVIALIAGVLGFSGIAGASAGIAQILFFLFLAFLVISLDGRPHPPRLTSKAGRASFAYASGLASRRGRCRSASGPRKCVS